jgi:ADP-ribosyl-[dinitrogen reductase] hydrolase
VDRRHPAGDLRGAGRRDRIARSRSRRLQQWFAEGPKDVGNQTRAVLGAAQEGSELLAASREHSERHPHQSAGNGSLMRTAPVALAHLGDDEAIIEAAFAVSALTHADPLAGEACAIWCIAIDRAVRERRLDGIWDGVDLLPGDAPTRWAGWLLAAETEPPSSFAPNGFVVTALQAAWAAIHQTPVPRGERCVHLQNSLHAAIRIGNDTDTVAAIAGSLLGARWGASAIPLGWKSMLHGWPGLRARDLLSLAVLAVRRGEPDDVGWPTAPDVAGWYEANYGERAYRLVLPDDPGVTFGNAPGAATTESDVVLSCCRMGTAVPAGAHAQHELIFVDSPHADDNPNLDFVLRDAAHAITAWRDDGKTVYVHCVAGISRTPTVVAAYLAARLGIDGRQALARVTEAHPRAHPNPAFLEALARL